MLKTLMLAVFVSGSFLCNAAFVTSSSTKSGQQQKTKTVTLKQFEAATGKHLNWLQRIQFNMAIKKLNKGNYDSAWDAEELTEGFQFWPFIGSFLTLGTVYIVMLFTAKDSNALRWARWGAFAIWIVWLVATIILISSGDYY